MDKVSITLLLSQMYVFHCKHLQKQSYLFCPLSVLVKNGNNTETKKYINQLTKSQDSWANLNS